MNIKWYIISTIGILDNMSSNFKVFPNPTTGKVMLSISQIEIPYSIHIKDLSGREIYFSKTIDLYELKWRMCSKSSFLL